MPYNFKIQTRIGTYSVEYHVDELEDEPEGVYRSSIYSTRQRRSTIKEELIAEGLANPSYHQTEAALIACDMIIKAFAEIVCCWPDSMQDHIETWSKIPNAIDVAIHAVIKRIAKRMKR